MDFSLFRVFCWLTRLHFHSLNGAASVLLYRANTMGSAPSRLSRASRVAIISAPGAPPLPVPLLREHRACKVNIYPCAGVRRWRPFVPPRRVAAETAQRRSIDRGSPWPAPLAGLGELAGSEKKTRVQYFVPSRRDSAPYDGTSGARCPDEILAHHKKKQKKKTNDERTLGAVFILLVYTRRALCKRRRIKTPRALLARSPTRVMAPDYRWKTRLDSLLM